MTKFRTVERLTLERVGRAYALTLQFKDDEPLSVAITANLLHGFVDSAQQALGKDAPSGLDLDDGSTDPWIEGP